MVFPTLYSDRPRVEISEVGVSLTQQNFKDDADINIILNRFKEPAQRDLLSVSGPRVPMWGDFTQVPTLKEAYSFFDRAQASFDALPAELRKRFNNNPLEMLSFVQTADPADLKDVFGVRAPEPAKVVPKADGVSAVNGETVEGKKE